MKSNSILSEEEFLAKIDKLSKPMAKANLDHMHSLVIDPSIKEFINRARKDLGIPKKGLKPNTKKAYYSETRVHGGLILLYTTTLKQRNLLFEYVDQLVSKFDIYEHFREVLAIYIVHNLIFAPGHNVSIKYRLSFKRSAMPEIHPFRIPYVNDWEIAKLLVERHRVILSKFMTGLPPLKDKFKKSYRGKVNLERYLKIVNEASDRSRQSAVEEIRMRNSDLADIYLNDESKAGTVKKLLNRGRKRIKEVTSN